MRSIRMSRYFPLLCLAALAGSADSYAAQSPARPAATPTGNASSSVDGDRPSDTGAKRSVPAAVTRIPAPTVTLSANPTTVNSGGSTQLTWSSTNATSCTASGGWTGTKATSGNQTISNLTSTTTFSLQCHRRNRVSAVRSVTVTVNAAPTPPTATLSANPTVVNSGGSTQLSWSSTNATSCTAAGGWSGSKPTSGNETIGNLAATTTFSLICSGAGGASPAQNVTVTVAATTAGLFPRLAGYLIGNPHNFDEPAYQSQIARLDLAVLGMYNGWNRGGKSPAQAVAEIKARNPAILLANYTLMTEVSTSTADVAQAYKRDKLNAEVGPNATGDWWAYNAAGQHTDWSGGSFGSWDTNLTLFTTPDVNGDRWPQWLAKADHSRLLQGADFDIWYSDNNMWRPRSNVDWDRNGTDDGDSITTRNWWRDGQRAYYDTARATAPNMLVMVNADNDLSGTVFPPGADQFEQYRNAVHGAFLERVMGESWSAETWGGWELAMSWYYQIRTNLLDPKIVMFEVGLPSTSDYQYLRYAFASALMNDGYFTASTDSNQIPWFDEFDLAGTASTKWLGQAVDPPPMVAWQNGVFRRRFQNGMAIVNPRGNGPRTVTIEAGYRRFMGNQAPAVNNGLPATSITLVDRDGILLMKE